MTLRLERSLHAHFARKIELLVQFVFHDVAIIRASSFMRILIHSYKAVRRLDFDAPLFLGTDPSQTSISLFIQNPLGNYGKIFPLHLLEQTPLIITTIKSLNFHCTTTFLRHQTSRDEASEKSLNLTRRKHPSPTLAIDSREDKLP
jgi:hypothetical protein